MAEAGAAEPPSHAPRRKRLLRSSSGHIIETTEEMRAAFIVLLDKYAAAEENGVPDMFTEVAYEDALEATGFPSWWHLQRAACKGTSALASALGFDLANDRCLEFPQSCLLLKQEEATEEAAEEATEEAAEEATK